jgi:adenylate cyclase
VALIRQTAFKLITKPGTTEVEMARTAEALALQAAPRIAPMMDGLMRMHLRQMFEAEGISAAERATGELPGARQVAVAFADLAGFTRLGEAAPPEELARVAGKLADLTHDIVTAPVRFIKTIGDAVMLTSPEPLPLLVNVTQLVDAAVEHRLPQLRAGVAMGPAVSHGGDWFGSPVNIASRVTAVARPGTVLAAEPMWSALGSAQGLTWEPAGTHELRGVTRPLALYSVRRATAPQ